MRKIAKIAVAALMLVTVLTLAVFLLDRLVLHTLSDRCQNILVGLGATAVVVIGVLAGVAQLSGLSLRDLFLQAERPSESLRERDRQGIVLVDTGDEARLRWDGDVFGNGATKVVVGSVNVPHARTRVATIERLINDIQEKLHEDNSLLPYVLTLCLDLADRVSLTGEYGRWLKKELEGYPGYDNFQRQFENEERFEEWMERWGRHRILKTHIQFGFTSAETGRWRIEDLDFSPLLMAESLATIARNIEWARENSQSLLSVPLRSLGEEHFADLQAFASEHLPGSTVPKDIRVFYRVSDLESILGQVRSNVLALLSDARQRIAPDS